MVLSHESSSDFKNLSPSSSPGPPYTVEIPPSLSSSSSPIGNINRCSSPAYHSDSSDSMAYTSSANASPTPSSAESSTGGSLGRKGNKKNRRYRRHYCYVVDEEEGEGEDGGENGRHKQDSDNYECFRILFFGFGLFFAGFCLIIWGASKPYKTLISVKSLNVSNLYYGQGSDYTGVPTKLLTMNCSASIFISNPATFFGIHVSSQFINLNYLEITIAKGQMEHFYQPRKSSRNISVDIVGNTVPLYGAGFMLADSDRSGGIPLSLDIEIKLTARLLGELVKTKHTRHISCSLTVNSKKTKDITFDQNSCKNVK